MRPLYIPILTLAALLTGTGCHKEKPEAPPEKPAPGIDGLREVLAHTAEQTLVAPPLANEQVIVPVNASETEARAGAVLKIASDAGGAGVRSTDAQGHVSILATIPENNAEAFKAALRHVKVSMESPSKGARLIEVLLEPPAPSPTP